MCRVVYLAHYSVLRSHPGDIRIQRTLTGELYWPNTANGSNTTVGVGQSSVLQGTRNRHQKKLRQFQAGGQFDFLAMHALRQRKSPWPILSMIASSGTGLQPFSKWHWPAIGVQLLCGNCCSSWLWTSNAYQPQLSGQFDFLRRKIVARLIQYVADHGWTGISTYSSWGAFAKPKSTAGQGECP